MLHQVIRVFVHGGETAEQRDGGKGEGNEGADHSVANERAAAKARIIVSFFENLYGASARLVGATHRVALIDALLVGHDGLAPVDGGNSDCQERKSAAQTDVEGAQSNRRCISAFNGEKHVRKNCENAAGNRQVEKPCHDACGARQPTRVGVGHTLTVGRQTRIGERVGCDDGRAQFFTGQSLAGCGYEIRFLRTLDDLGHCSPLNARGGA